MHRVARVIVLSICLALALAQIPMLPEAAVVKPAKVKISTLTSGTSKTEGEITIKWGKVTCTGYQMEYADNKKFTGSRTWSAKGAGSVMKAVTCLVGGKTYYFRVRAYKTSGSSQVYGPWSAVKSIQAHQHEFSSEVTEEPSCGVAGLETYTCAGCGYSYTVKLAPLVHDYRMKVTKKATSKEAGERTWTCTRCKDHYTERIPKKQRKTKADPTKAKPAQTTRTKATTTKPAQPATSSQTAVDPAKADPTKAKPAKKKPSKAKKLSRAQRNKKARQAAVDWAVRIAKDESFHYGRPSWAHHHGCYFCGTNQKKGSAKRKAGASASACAKTYCCNPFVTAAYHHGAGAPEVDCRKASKRINLANDSNKALKKKKSFRRIAKPKKVTSLEVGDILLTPTHAMLYAGKGCVVHAAHHDNGKRGKYWNDSIKVGKIDGRQWKRTTKIYRYLGTGKF